MLKILIAIVLVLAVSIGGKSLYKQYQVKEAAAKLAQDETAKAVKATQQEKAKVDAAKAVQEAQIAAAKSRLEGALKDPTSVQYRNLIAVLHTSTLREASHTTCGEINAKNSYGGYVGFRRFIYEENDKSIEFEPTKDATPYTQKFFEVSYLIGCTPQAELDAICKANPERCDVPIYKLGQ